MMTSFPFLPGNRLLCRNRGGIATALVLSLILTHGVPPFNAFNLRLAYAQSASSQASRVGGRLTIAIPWPIYKLEPLASRDPLQQLILANLAWPLTRLDGNGHSTLVLAEAIERNPDATVWTFTLNRDARFSTGRTLSPAAVIASFKALQSQATVALEREEVRMRLRPNAPLVGEPGFDSAVAGVDNTLLRGLLNIDTIREVSEERTYRNLDSRVNGVQFTLKAPDMSFDRSVATLPVLDADMIHNFADQFAEGTNLAGIAPYTIEENRPHAGIKLHAVSNFFLTSIPHSATLEFKFYDDAAAALSALRVGSVDLIAIPTDGQIVSAKEDPTLAILPSPFLKGGRTPSTWSLRRTTWSNHAEASDRLQIESILARKSLKLDNNALLHFDLSGSFLP